jgi:protein phosphatase
MMDNTGKNERDLTPSRIINSSKNTRLSTQVVIAKGDKNSLQLERVPVNSLMEESKKLNNQNYEDSSCSNAFDQGLQELIDNILIILMPVNGGSKIMNSNIFPLKKDKIYRLCHEVSKILIGESSLIGIRAPIKIFGSIYGQYSELIRFF